MIDQRSADELFIHLVFGIYAYSKAEWLSIPNSLRRALNTLSFAAPGSFPKTLRQFVERCHQPVGNWYPYEVPDGYNPSQPLLYDGELSEEAQDYYLDLSEEMELSESVAGDVPQAALDNHIMIDLRQRLNDAADQTAAQQIYVDVRSFLITYSWATLDQLREQPRAVMQELVNFYEEMPRFAVDQLPVCDRCGLLVRHGDKWQGIKPGYCSDHGTGSPHIHLIKTVPQMYRLRGGVQLRTFIPGRVELTLFTYADELHAEYPELVLSPQRYPGLDTYDLRLSFSDGEVWAIDAKDHRRPDRLARDIRFPYGEGDLRYNRCFYVIPDARLNEGDYRQRLERAMDPLPGNLIITSVSSFQSRLEDKVKSLQGPKSTKRKRA